MMYLARNCLAFTPSDCLDVFGPHCFSIFQSNRTKFDLEVDRELPFHEVSVCVFGVHQGSIVNIQTYSNELRNRAITPDFNLTKPNLPYIVNMP